MTPFVPSRSVHIDVHRVRCIQLYSNGSLTELRSTLTLAEHRFSPVEDFSPVVALRRDIERRATAPSGSSQVMGCSLSGSSGDGFPASLAVRNGAAMPAQGEG